MIVNKHQIILPNGVAGFDGSYFCDVGHDIDHCKVDNMFQASVPGQFAKNVHRSLRCMEAVAVHAGTQLSCTMLCLMKCCLMLLYTAEPNLTIISFMLLIMTHLRIGM